MSKRSEKLVNTIQLLQNGYPIHTLEYTGKRTRRVRLGRHSNFEFSLPLYNFKRSLTFARIANEKLHIQLPGEWHGYIYEQVAQKITDCPPKEKGLQRWVIRPTESAVFHRGDLTLLFKVNYRRLGRPEAISLKANPLSLYLPHSAERRSIFSAAAISFVLLAGLIWTLNNSSLQTVESIAEIPDKYSLPFIYPKHLANLPEALQEDFARRNYKRAAVNFADAFTSQFLNWSSRNDNLLYPNSKTLFRQSAITMQQKVQEIIAQQAQQQERSLQQALTGVAWIPSVQGESAMGSVARIFDKLDLMHESFESALQQRRSIIPEYLADPEYDYTDYRKGSMQKSTSGKDALAKISPFSLLNNENFMYAEGERLAQLAFQYQQRIAKHRNSQLRQHLLNTDEGPIGIAPVHSGISHLHQATFDFGEDKINSLTAVSYNDRDQRLTSPEPATGSIEPRAIERQVRERQFEIQQCFETALRRNQGLRGKMEWQWRIDTSGRISELTLLSTSITDKAMQDCVKTRISKWRFTRPNGGSVMVRYPFEFTKDRG